MMKGSFGYFRGFPFLLRLNQKERAAIKAILGATEDEVWPYIRANLSLDILGFCVVPRMRVYP